jgi:hypothetical protein
MSVPGSVVARVPIVAAPAGSLLGIPDLQDGARVFGALDVRAVKTGLAGCDTLELYVDDVKQGTGMTALGGNLFTQQIETSFWPDGAHRITVCAVGPTGALGASVARELVFRNVGSVTVNSVRPTGEGDGFALVVRVNAMRARLDADRFLCDGGAGARVPLAVRVEYHDDPAAVPVLTLFAALPPGRTIDTKAWRLSVTVLDNRGVPSAWTATTWAPPLT